MATSTRIAQRYATALMSIANDNNTTEDIRKDFTLIVESLNVSDELRALFNSPVVKYHHKIYICKELSADLSASIVKAIADKTGKTVLPHFSVDPAIKGGLIITIADMMIDASVRHQLNKLQVELSGSYAVTM